MAQYHWDNSPAALHNRAGHKAAGGIPAAAGIRVAEPVHHNKAAAPTADNPAEQDFPLFEAWERSPRDIPGDMAFAAAAPADLGMAARGIAENKDSVEDTPAEGIPYIPAVQADHTPVGLADMPLAGAFDVPAAHLPGELPAIPSAEDWHCCRYTFLPALSTHVFYLNIRSAHAFNLHMSCI